MITVLPITDRAALQALFAQRGLPFGANAAGVAARSGEEMLGVCLFDLTEREILIRLLEPQDDPMMADGVLRSALHVAAQRSAMDAHYADTVPEPLLQRLGFIADAGERRLDIDKLFRPCCCTGENCGQS